MTDYIVGSNLTILSSFVICHGYAVQIGKQRNISSMLHASGTQENWALAMRELEHSVSFPLKVHFTDFRNIHCRFIKHNVILKM